MERVVSLVALAISLAALVVACVAFVRGQRTVDESEVARVRVECEGAAASALAELETGGLALAKEQAEAAEAAADATFQLVQNRVDDWNASVALGAAPRHLFSFGAQTLPLWPTDDLDPGTTGAPEPDAVDTDESNVNFLSPASGAVLGATVNSQQALPAGFTPTTLDFIAWRPLVPTGGGGVTELFATHVRYSLGIANPVVETTLQIVVVDVSDGDVTSSVWLEQTIDRAAGQLSTPAGTLPFQAGHAYLFTMRTQPEPAGNYGQATLDLLGVSRFRQ